MAWGLEGKVVAITGAGKGLGRAYALLLAQLGARVVVNNRRHEGEAASSADEVVGLIHAAGGLAVAEHSSVEDPESGERLLETALQAFSRLDAVIANAGVASELSFHKQDLQDFRRVIEINLMGTVHTLQPAFRHLYRQRSGRLLLSTSVAGLHGGHGLAAYATSKAALLGLMQSLKNEGAAHGVHTNAIAPFASTQMTERELPASLVQRLRPERVAPVAAWLVSEACPLNGEIVIAGAGRAARARMLQTGTWEFEPAADWPSGRLLAEWQALAALPLDRAHASALEQFRDFLGE